MNIGDRVRHIPHFNGMPAETGIIKDILYEFNDRHGGKGKYNPPGVIVELDLEFVTGTNKGLATFAMNRLEIIL